MTTTSRLADDLDDFDFVVDKPFPRHRPEMPPTTRDLLAEIGLTERVLDWQGQAVCAQTDPEAFFPEKGGTANPAKQICDDCPVQQQCLDYALANDEPHGIWGGLSDRQRRAEKRRRQLRADRAA